MLKTKEKNNNNSSKLIRGEKKKRDGLKSKMWKKTRKKCKREKRRTAELVLMTSKS